MADQAFGIFVRQIRNRSTEHRLAMKCLHASNLPGQMVAVLRQELDSMVRTIYLLHQPEARRRALIQASVNGERWTEANSRSRVTGANMVTLASDLEGWAQSAYKFGCAFIHLSNFHDYNNRDPLLLLPAEERDDLLSHCRHYHGGPDHDRETFADLIPYFPRILEKMSGNLECYLAELENRAT